MYVVSYFTHLYFGSNFEIMLLRKKTEVLYPQAKVTYINISITYQTFK